MDVRYCFSEVWQYSGSFSRTFSSRQWRDSILLFLSYSWQPCRAWWPTTEVLVTTEKYEKQQHENRWISLRFHRFRSIHARQRLAQNSLHFVVQNSHGNQCLLKATDRPISAPAEFSLALWLVVSHFWLKIFNRYNLRSRKSLAIIGAPRGEGEGAISPRSFAWYWKKAKRFSNFPTSNLSYRTKMAIGVMRNWLKCKGLISRSHPACTDRI